MKKENSTWIIFIVIFILVGLAFDPLKKGASNINKSSGSKFDSSISSSPQNEPNVDDIKSAQAEIKRLEDELAIKQEDAIKSPYFGKVEMTYIDSLNDPNPDREYITLYTNLDEKEKINITGWFLKSSQTGNFAKIGQATLLPFPYSKTDSDIILHRDDRVILTKGFSPIGISFRTNKCTGYFEQDRTFYPPLTQICPAPSDEKLPRFSSVEERNDECLDIINGLPRCETVNQQFTRDLPDTVSSSCKEYMLNQINYNTCVAKHFSDVDFPGNEYRFYFKTFGQLWKTRHDEVVLYDQNGLVVSKIKY